MAHVSWLTEGEVDPVFHYGNMSIFSLYLLSFPLGVAAIFFAYQASQEHMGRGERTIWLASSYGLLTTAFLILLYMLTGF